MADDQPRVLPKSRARVVAASDRCREWVDAQPQHTFKGVAIAAWRRYRDVDGPLESALLSLYILIAVLPAIYVMEAYIDSNPGALSDQLVTHYRLSNETAGLLRSVLAQDTSHKLGSALIAVAGALFFGLGFARVLQIVHARSWQITLPQRATDQLRYGTVLAALYGLLLLLLL